MRQVPVIPCLVLIACIVSAGCTGSQVRPAYSVDNTGKLSATCYGVTASEKVLIQNGTYTKSRITFHTQDGDVIAYLATPERPVAAVVYAPGAGETVAAHEGRMLRYAQAGYAFFFIDTRGNGGETAGLPFSQQLVMSDYEKFSQGKWPQYYMTVCDLSSARKYLAERVNIPVYAMGSSNGGRYAAVAADVDPSFAGYIGISTSDWGIRDAVRRQGVTGAPLAFATSLEPSTYIASISPRPVRVFHSKSDTIIPYTDGQALFDRAEEPRAFTEFAGAHGINSAVDDSILSEWAQIYGTRG